MSENDKKKVDIETLSTKMRDYLVGIGSIVIIVGTILYLLNINQQIRLLSLSGIVILGVLLMVFTGQGYQKK